MHASTPLHCIFAEPPENDWSIYVLLYHKELLACMYLFAAAKRYTFFYVLQMCWVTSHDITRIHACVVGCSVWLVKGVEQTPVTGHYTL
jgi:hypothetical protein